MDAHEEIEERPEEGAGKAQCGKCLKKQSRFSRQQCLVHVARRVLFLFFQQLDECSMVTGCTSGQCLPSG